MLPDATQRAAAASPAFRAAPLHFAPLRLLPACPFPHALLQCIEKAHAGKVTFEKVDTEKHPEVADAHRIQKLPTLVLFRDGQQVLPGRGPALRVGPSAFRCMLRPVVSHVLLANTAT